MTVLDFSLTEHHDDVTATPIVKAQLLDPGREKPVAALRKLNIFLYGHLTDKTTCAEA